MTVDLDALADTAVEVERRVVELAGRRAAIRRAGMATPELDRSVAALRAVLAEMAERLMLP